ncbi:unnamed protein product [Peniophora sp. CBMAI 1063]|nr:unnamed protein product [Peniophora sp. CBMAI 1063]
MSEQDRLSAEQRREESHVTQSQLLAEEMAIFHLLLQKQDEPQSKEEHAESINEVANVNDKKLTEAQAARLRQTVTISALASTLKKTASDSAPGPDGLTFEFWKHFRKRAAERKKQRKPYFCPITLIHAAFDDIEKHGLCEAAHINDGLLCPIYKKGPRDLPQNYQPITLLNTDYKLYTKWRSLLLAPVMPYLVSKDQAGFLARRSIYDNVALARMVMAHGEVKNKNGVLVLLDQEKAYDKIDLDYLWSVVRAYNIPEEWIAPVEALYAKATSKVIINGVMSQPFELTRGVRQGDPLSCLLFVLAIEPLAEMLRKSELKGIETPNSMECLITTLFADDTIVFLNCDDDFATLEQILTNWCKASRARFNIAKTEIIPFGDEAFRRDFINDRRAKPSHQRIPNNVRILPDGEAARLLGARVGNKLSPDTIWGPTLQKLEARMAFWSERDRYPDLRVQKMFADWLPAGMTQFLAMCQGMPKYIIDRVTKLQQNFIWKGSRYPTINIKQLQRSKYEGGLGLIDLHARIKAIQVMRIKRWLNGEEQPRWANFANAIIASRVTQEEEARSDEELRWNPFTQAWLPPGNSHLASHWPQELQEIMNTASKLDIALHILFPSQELRKRLPIWNHIALTSTNQRIRVKVRNLLRLETSECLWKEHGVSTVEDLERIANSRKTPLITKTRKTATATLAGTNAIKASRWNPKTPDPPNPHGNEHPTALSKKTAKQEGECAPITAPRTLISGNEIADAIRLFAPQPPSQIKAKARYEAWHNAEAAAFADSRTNPNTNVEEITAEVIAAMLVTDDDIITRHGALLHPEGSHKYNLPQEFEIRPQCSTQENNPIRPLILATIQAIDLTDQKATLIIRTTELKFASILTEKKQAEEDLDLLNLRSADAWRTLFAKVNQRSGVTKVILTSASSTEAKNLLSEASNEPENQHSDLTNDDSVERWRPKGAILSKMTQKLAYKFIKCEHPITDKETPTIHLAMARHAACEQNGSLPSNAAVWATTWSKDLKTNDQEWLWKTIHGGFKIGKYWESIRNYEQRGRCSLCDAERESMEHVLFECDIPGAAEVWEEAKSLWERNGSGPWPTGNQFGVIMAAGLMRFKRNRKRNRGAEHLFRIIVSTACRTIWNIRCERVIQEKEISASEAKVRWWSNIKKRLNVDQAMTSKRFDNLAISRQRVHDTWYNILKKDNLPQGEWIGRGVGVLVGSNSLASEFGIT